MNGATHLGPGAARRLAGPGAGPGTPPRRAAPRLGIPGAVRGLRRRGAGAVRRLRRRPPPTRRAAGRGAARDALRGAAAAGAAGVVCAVRGGRRAALHALKYAGERRLAGRLGRVGRRSLAGGGRGGDLLVQVPVHAERRARRGYDQAGLLAAATARRWPSARAGARGTRATGPQFELDHARRAANVAGAFGEGAGNAAVAGAGSSSWTTSSRPAPRSSPAPRSCWARGRRRSRR